MRDQKLLWAGLVCFMTAIMTTMLICAYGGWNAGVRAGCASVGGRAVVSFARVVCELPAAVKP